MAPFFKAHDLFGLGVDGIAGAVMFDIADDTGFDPCLVTMAGIVVADVPVETPCRAMPCNCGRDGKQ